MSADLRDTREPAYTDRLLRSTRTWVATLRQLPYRAHIRALRLGEIIDLGCGVGRNLAHNGGRGVGIDHSETSVAAARARGLDAYTPDQFAAFAGALRTWDAILCAHVAEHVERDAFLALAATYVERLAAGGRFVLINPQRRGYASDPTHVRYVDFAEQRALLESLGLHVMRQYSFPFPAAAGNVFAYNEFVTIARRS